MPRVAHCLTYFLFIQIVFISCQQRQQDTTSIPPSDTLGIHVPPGYEVIMAADSSLVDFPMFANLDEFGRLFVFESIGNVYEKTEDALKNPRFRIKLLEDTSHDGVYDKATIFADKLSFPQGGVFYRGSLYASSAPDLLKLTDTNGDNVADKREVILTGWILNVNANSLVGPVMGPDGWLYMNSAIMGFDVTTKEGKRLRGETARTWRLKPDGSSLEWISAGGMNNPVELTFTEAGEPIGTETYFTDPRAGERDAIVYWTEGGVYPKPNNNISHDSLVRTGELMPVVSKYSRVAPSGICRYRSKAFGNDLKNNLFSAQFNTHRVLRHILNRNGASFTIKDEVFFESKNEDFHPTDVLEDADGSLLVVETGGWFIQGCPLSQMSKPELKGAIYRVRKVGQEKPEDPYGISIKWNSKDPDYIGQFLKDSRPFVAEKALQVIADLGEDAVDALQSVLETSESPDARTKAVFALYRISTPGSLATLRKYITDKDPNVSIAASRCAGLYKDMLSVPQLSKSLSATDLGVRRQAATALGQIKSKEAVDALMQAASSPANDRFLEHAITYALVNIADSGKVKTALANSSPRVISTAITALDQMIGSPVKVSDVYPHLSSTNPDLQQRAFWIASHHREWASEIIRFLPTGLKSDSVNAAEERQLHDVMVAFATERPMQIFMANLFEDASQPRQLMILDAMLKSQVKQFPALWQNLIRKQLSSGSPELVSRSLQLVQMNQLKSMDGAVLSVANNEQNPASIRLQALLSLQSANKKLNGRQFEFVLSQVSDSSEAVLRQQSASVLEKFNLTTGQLQTVADKILPTADGYTLTRLVPVFRTGRSARIGLSLANTLRNSPALDGFSEENINTIFKSYPAEVKPAVDSLLVKLKQVHAGRLARLKEFETLVGSGNLDRGRILFFGKATCGNCHTVGPDGGSFGPDLTSIQRDRSSHDLLEAILYPGASFVREFETYVVKTSRGEHTGIIRQRSPSGLELAVGPQSSVRIPSSDITSIQLSETSMMPQGFDKILSKQEISDLLVFLIAQDQDPETDENILR